MKNIKEFLFLILLAPTWLLATSFLTEFRVGCFYPCSHSMREIYQNGAVEYELEQSVYLNRKWLAWGNINYFRLNGHASGCNGSATMSGYPLSFGVKYNFYQRRNLDLYVGVGGSYTSLRFHDHSPYVKQKYSKTSFGVVVKSGLLFFINRNIFVDAFLDYYHSHVSGVKNNSDQVVYSRSQNLNVLRVGLGVGIAY